MNEHRPVLAVARVRELLDDGGPAPGTLRVLVDRLWPRGIARTRLVLDEWAKDLAPSTELRRDFHHGELGFEAFAERYRAELAASPAPAAFLERAAEAGADRIELVYAARDAEHNHALVLRDHLLTLTS
ncbi:DUF488 domain-containing protein [Brachybacterium squillarum]|uniref:DUF488 domain-containing protein n=1 Tax=Brachybacterium squillarum TaxID=661979 RepID=UPI000262A1FB|nr:DUF488 family protein [Brachybacterium squillarum]